MADIKKISDDAMINGKNTVEPVSTTENNLGNL